MSMVLKNYTRVAVEEALDTILARQGACECDTCRLDIMAIALNNLKPHYVVTEKGELFARVGKMDFQSSIDVTTEISAAIETVKSRPRHP